jgi:hypothetical protein
MAQRNGLITGVILLSVTATQPVAAGDLDVPNRFTANTRAVAAEVNANFDAVEAAVDDNAADIAALESTLSSTGVTVSIAGSPAGRYLASTSPFANVVTVDGVSVVRVAEFTTMGTAPVMTLISPNGYRFPILTSDFDHPVRGEGMLNDLFIFYDDPACSGSMYFPVEGDTGFFSLFKPGTGQGRPAKRWTVRQGLVYATPDPLDANPAYMIRRNRTVETVALGSFSIYSEGQGQAICVPLTVLNGYDPNNPLDVDHTAVPIEPNDSAESGVASTLGGPITLDF